MARKDNSLLTVLLDGRIQRDAEGKFLKMHCILHNITERKRLEEERQRAEQALWKQYELMRVLLSAIPAYVYIKNTDLVYILGNKRFSELSGIPEDEIPGKTDYDFFSKTDADNFRRNDAEILASGTERLTYEMQGQSAEGKTVWFSTSKCPFYDPSGEVAGLVGICIDITKQKQLEQERFQLAEKLQQSEKAESLSRMAGAIAHHFNNLLGVILGSLELSLIDLPSKPGLLQNIETAVKTSNRATELTRLILAYLGQSVGKKKPIQLSETLRQALSLVRAALPANLRVNTELPSGGPMIRADAVQIEQILTNLMVNAAEALGNQEGEITVALNTVSGGDIRATRFYPVEWKPKEQTYARVTVSDTGCGMDTETMERVFDPFYSTKFMGRGMGLSVALGLVRTHEGAFTLESEVGLGSTFKIFLPAIEQEAPGHHPSRALKLDTAIEHGLILLVDDEPMVRQMCTAMLEVLGYKVMAAADGVEAMAIFSQHKQDIRCVLLDLVMPRMNGWETLAALRSLRPGVPAVLVSGYDQAEAMQGDHTEQPGCFLHKPYTMADLQAVLAKALE